MTASVDVSVEVLHECLIQEVTLDGQEIYVQPLSMSENLTKLAHKIDFSKDESDEKGKPTSEGGQVRCGGEGDEEEEKPLAAPNQASLWPWDSVRSKLRTAVTELSVLIDVLSVLRQKNFLVADAVATDASDTRNSVQTLAKKKALGAAGSLLLKGYDRLHRSQDAAARRTSPDFHYELQRLRQSWRLKKVGGTILGDLSYKSAGSRFWQSGSFEVSKAPDTKDSDALPTNQLSALTPQPRSVLRVTVPSELEGVAYIHVCVRDTRTGLSSFDQRSCRYGYVYALYRAGRVDLNAPPRPSPAVTLDLPASPRPLTACVPAEAHWQTRLEAAQNVIFCREVFAQLAREAVQTRALVPHVVVGNQIIAHLFPDAHLSISLCHNTGRLEPGGSQGAAGGQGGAGGGGASGGGRGTGGVAGGKISGGVGAGGLIGGVGKIEAGSIGFGRGMKPGALSRASSVGGVLPPGGVGEGEDGSRPDPAGGAVERVLEHSLHQLLREAHHRCRYHPMPHPVTATFGVSKRRRLAGPLGYSRAQLLELTPSESMLEQVVQQAKHIVVRQRVLRVLDEMARSIDNPQISAHWSNVSSATESMVKISISFCGYDTCRSACALHMKVDSLEAYCREGRLVSLSYEDDQLTDFLLSQVSEHHIHAAQTLAKAMGWRVLSVSGAVGVGDLEPLGSAHGILLASPYNDRVLSIRSSPTAGVSVKVQTCPNFADSHVSTAAPKPKWSGKNELYQSINLTRLEGNNFASKLETIMSCLMPERLEFGLF